MTINDALIGAVGVGHMGGGMARNALRGGFKLLACDLRAEARAEFSAAGAQTAETVLEAAERCDVLTVCVVNDEQLKIVFDDVLKAQRPPSTVIVHSTVLPSTVTEFGERAAGREIAVVDAPVSGGHERSERGQLTLLIGGDADAVEYCMPYFAAVSSFRFHIGPLGGGEAAKLVNNSVTLGVYALCIEAMQLADAYGISEDMVTRFVSVSSGDVRELRTWGRHDTFRQEHTMTGTPAVYDMQTKDLIESVLAAGQRGVHLPLISAVAGLMPGKLMARDALLATRPPLPTGPLCEICGQILAAPFREYRVHPECRPFD